MMHTFVGRSARPPAHKGGGSQGGGWSQGGRRGPRGSEGGRTAAVTRGLRGFLPPGGGCSV
eukprot:212756-Prorocentrum_minimum.AAC.2